MTSADASTVSVRLTGGLGNQMFEYAAGRAMAVRLGARLRLDPTLIAYPGRHETPRSMAIDCFNIKGAISEPQQSSLRRLLSYSPVSTRIWDLLPGPFMMDRRPHHLDERLLRRNGAATISGYWQREEYFSDVADVIRDDFMLSTPPGPRWQRVAERIASGPSLGVHVRRGDYVTNARANAHHGLPGVEYVRRALALLGSATADVQSFVFSDDPDWCRRELGFLPQATFVQGFKDYEELVLLSRCQHKVIANSSFSWWAAWLGEPSGGTIVAPRTWLQGAEPDVPSPVPARWARC